jgi:hypothetical protein
VAQRSTRNTVNQTVRLRQRLFPLFNGPSAKFVGHEKLFFAKNFFFFFFFSFAFPPSVLLLPLFFFTSNQFFYFQPKRAKK